MADVSNLTLWRRGIRRGLVNVWRERNWLTALGALTGVFLLLQLMVLVLLGMQSFQQVLRERTDLRLELQATAEDQEIQGFLSAVSSLPYVETSVYVTKEQAYSQVRKQDPELISFLEEFEFENPFPETVAVTLNSLDDYPAFNSFIKQEQWQNVVDPGFLSKVTNQEQQVQALLRLTQTGGVLTLFFLILTGSILLFVTTELVRGRVLRLVEDVVVEHISGASLTSILLPFAVEAVVLLLLALAISIIFVGGAVALVPLVAPDFAAQESLLKVQQEISIALQQQLPIILGIELIGILLVGWFGAWLGVAPKIKSPSLLLRNS